MFVPFAGVCPVAVNSGAERQVETKGLEFGVGHSHRKALAFAEVTERESIPFRYLSEPTEIK